MSRVSRVAVVLLASLATASFAMGMPAMLWAGALMGLPEMLRFGVAVMVDGSIIIFGLAATARRSRREPALFSWASMATLTLTSMALQTGHVLSLPPLEPMQRGVAVFVGCLIPLTVFGSTHTLLDMVVAPAPTKARRRAAAMKAAAVPTAVAATPSPAPAAPVAPRTVAATPAPRPVTRPAKPVAVGHLPSGAELLALREVEGLSNSVIAKRFGTSRSKVQRTIAKAAKEARQSA